MASAAKPFSPTIDHVTTVRSPAGRNVNSAMLVPLSGCSKSSVTRISSGGRLSTMVMRPWPASRFPDQV